MTGWMCALIGHHRWPSMGMASYEVCDRCGIDSDHAGKLADRWRAVQKWSPLWVRRSRRELLVRVGWDWRVALAATLRFHWGFDGYGECPGLHVGLHLWRLEAGASIGGFWQDEDGNGRALLCVWANGETDGIADTVCRVVGHHPDEPLRMSGSVYCKRCGNPLPAASQETSS